VATITRIRSDRTNYSQYDPQANTITAVCYLSGVSDGDTVSCELVRNDGYGTVKTVTSDPLSAGQTSVRLAFPLVACTDSLYPDINRARAGDYYLKDSAGNAVSPLFSVSLVSVRRMREEICKGLPLLTGDNLGPLQQPQMVTGVTINQVKPDMPGDVYTLQYTASGQLLSWDGGAPVAVGGGGTFYLVSSQTKWWVQVTVDELLLPQADATESIIIDEMQMTDGAILAELRHAEAAIADRLKAYLQPTQCASPNMLEWLKNPTLAVNPPTTAFADVILPPANYERPDNMLNWYSIQLPVRRLIQLEALHGFLNETDVVTLDQSWWTWVEPLGLVQLVPNQGAAISWQYYTGFFYNFLMGSYDYVPNFWGWKATCGFRNLSDPRTANILQAVEYQAAVNILRQASLHAKPGYTGESISRDGLSSSVTYGSGPGGVYSQHIQAYQAWLDEEVPKLERKHVGFNMYLVG
jgi:hypothetical protein